MAYTCLVYPTTKYAKLYTNNQYLEPFKSSKRQVIGLAIELDDMGKGLVDWGFAPV